MATVVVSISTKTEVFPQGTVLGGYVYTVNGVAQTITTELSATFTGVVEGGGTASVQAVDATGANLGTLATATFDVPVPVSLLVPDVVSVVVS